MRRQPMIVDVKRRGYDDQDKPLCFRQRCFFHACFYQLSRPL